MIRVDLPWTKPPVTSNRVRGNEFARAREIKEAKAQAQWAIKAARLGVIPGANLTLVLRQKDKRRRDADGLWPTYKLVADALVAEHVIPDDSWVFVPEGRCRIEPPVEGMPAAMWLLIEPLDDGGLGA